MQLYLAASSQPFFVQYQVATSSRPFRLRPRGIILYRTFHTLCVACVWCVARGGALPLSMLEIQTVTQKDEAARCSLKHFTEANLDVLSVCVTNSVTLLVNLANSSGWQQYECCGENVLVIHHNMSCWKLISSASAFIVDVCCCCHCSREFCWWCVKPYKISASVHIDSDTNTDVYYIGWDEAFDEDIQTNGPADKGSTGKGQRTESEEY